jgi:class 3 adenylate cyclase
MLGTSFPSKPGKLHVGLGLAQTKWRLRGHTRASLLALPRTDDPAVKARIEILVGAITPSFLAAPDLMPLLCFEALRLSLAHGNCRHSIHAYATWSLILIVALGDVAGAEMFDGVARQFVADFDATDMRSRVQLIHSVFIDHLRRPIVETADGLLEGHRVGVAMGDLETAALHVNGYHWTLVYGGARLDEIARSFDALMDPVRRCDVQHCIEEMILGRQFIRNLMDEAEDSRKLTGPDIEEDAFLALQIKANLRSEVALVGFLQGWLALLHGEPVHAHARFAFGAAYLDALAGTIAVPEYLFLQGVARSQAHASLPVGERAANLRGLASNLRALKRPAGLAPRNHQHKVDLLLAERARLQGDHPGAMAAFARGLKGAHDSGLVHEEALGHELAARFYLSIDQTVAARGHVREARDRYEAWGCTLKVRLLDREFDALLPRRLAAPATRASAPTESAAHRASLSGRPPHESSRNDEVGMLDLATLFKSSRVMIEEIVLDTLLGELLRMLLENAGAERGFLLLAEDDSLRVALEIAADGTKRTERRGAAVTDDLGLSTAIVQYVARTRESVVLNDAAGEGLFTRDPYVEAQKPRSVLCAPLVKRGRLEAVVYMENNLSAGAFTRDRLDVINLLTAQAALSIHNARLYDDLQRSLADQVKLAKAQARFVPNEFLEGLARRSIVDVALGEHVRREMSIVFSDIKGFTSLVEGMRPEEHIAFINEYLSYMEPAVLDHGGFVDSYIGDAIMALFQGGADGAVRAGIAMHEGLERYNAARALRGEAAVGMGVGVNTGLLTMGTIGGPQHIKCGVIGDAVNLAARVESLTRRWSSRLLITHFTRERLADATPYGLREIGRVTVVGKSTPVTLFEVLAAESPVVRDARLATLDRYGEGLESFYARRFDAAARCFEACASGADDPPAAMFLARSLALAREGVPDDWVGVEVLSNK